MFEEFTTTKKPAIDRQLDILLREERKDFPVAYRELIKQLAKLTRRGGKRLRPLLCLLAYEGYGGRSKAVLQVAAGQELLHAFLLVHDDIIDRDHYRYNGRNITGVYFEHYSKTMTPRDALHFAEAQALLAGDIAWSLATKALVTARFAPKVILKAQQLQQRTLQQVLAGEAADVCHAIASKMPTEAQILQMYRLKTSSYSFGLPLQIGALLAGASASELTKLGFMADNLGLAYQLQDDILGMFGSEAATGKPALSDLREGKQTLLIRKTFELASATQWGVVARVLGKANITEASRLQVQDIMRSCGAEQYVRDLVAEYVSAAVALLETTSLSATAKLQLHDLIGRLYDRQK